MDPYRGGSQVGTCVRCSNPTESDGELGRLVCVAGCGEWYPRAAFDKVWTQVTASLGTPAQPWPWSPPECPECKRTMATGYRGEVRFDFCAAHGIWLDAGEYERFATLFARS